jgi:ABC-type multidrug transport system ATPase subunit
MNESILQALMRLFALVAYVNEQGQPNIEREVVQEYLQRQFASILVEKYLYAFDRYLSEYHPDLSYASEDERKELIIVNSKAVLNLCNKLNEELEKEQKTFVLLFLLDFIRSGSQHSDYQFLFIERVATNLRIPEQEYMDARHFTFEEIQKIQSPENLLIINAAPPPNNKKIKHLFIDKMEGIIHVLHIPNTNTLVFRYEGSEVLLLNGYNLKSSRSYIWAPGSVIKNPKFGAIYYTWIAGKFIKKTEETQFVFTADEIEFSYGNSPNGIKRFNLNEESGRLIGIIGGSGSGKSTLIKLLAGIIKPNHGSIKINGFDIHEKSNDLKGIIGYVPQEEFLIKELTVFENLHYTAEFSFSHYRTKDINRLVDKALIDFDLVEARNLQVGDSLSTYLSGGQRKRLNIALELLREPAVLFVDEPTSGLSSMDSEKVMNLLKRQTFKGKLVFANIHQPSSDIFKLFDKLLVVDQGGRVIWYGNPVDAISYLKHANHYIDADTSECLSCGNINAEQILRNVEARVVDVNGKLTRNRKTTPQEWYEVYMSRIDPIIKNINRKHPENAPKSNFSAPSRWKQIKLYFKRDIYAKLKNQQYLLITLAEAPVLALLLAFYTRSSRDAAGNITNYTFGLNNNIPAFLFMAVIVALFLGLILSAEEIFRERKLLERERFLNLSRSSYLFSKTMVMFLISAMQMLIFILISNYILEIKDMNWRYFIILFSTAAWANMVGLNISSGFKSVVTIYILVPLILVPQLLFSGVVVDFNNLNRSIQSFKHVPAIGDAMTSRWSYEALVTTQFSDNKFQQHFFDSEQRMSEALYTKAYFIPELLKSLEFINTNIEIRKKYSLVLANFSLLQNELKKLEGSLGLKQNELIKQLGFEDYSEATYLELKYFLNTLKAKYHLVYLQALKDHDKAYENLKSSLANPDEFLDYKNKYANVQLSKIVKNEKELLQYFIHNNNIIKLKDPIYAIPFAKNGRTHFYAPKKRVGNVFIETYWFNVLIIWLSTIMWFLILYFDLLFNLLRYFENIRLRRFNKRIVSALHKQSLQQNFKK